MQDVLLSRSCNFEADVMGIKKPLIFCKSYLHQKLPGLRIIQEHAVFAFMFLWVFPKIGVPNNHGVFLLKMIISGCFGGTTI